MARSGNASTQKLVGSAEAIPSNVTVSLWYLNPNNAPENNASEWPQVFAWQSSSDEGLQFVWDHASAGSEFSWGFYDGTSWQRSQLNSGTGSQNTWYHTSFSHDGTDGTAYLNGSAETPITASAPTDAGSEQINWFVGIDGTDYYGDGYLAEVGVWNVALTAAEHAALAKGFSPLQVRPQNLIHYWRGDRTGDEPDLVGSMTLTNTSAGHQDHPGTLIYPVGQEYYLGGFSAKRRAIIDHIVAQSSPANGWNNQKANIPSSAVRRIDDTTAVITLPALSGYNISADETLDTTLPGEALTGGLDKTGTTWTILNEGFAITRIGVYGGPRVAYDDFLPKDSAGGTPVTYTLTAAAVNWTANALTSAMDATYTATQATLNMTEQSLTRTNNIAYVLTAAVINWTANALTTAMDSVWTMTAAAINWTANSLTYLTGKIYTMTAASINWTANALTWTAKYAGVLTQASINWTANSITRTRVILYTLSQATFSWSTNALTWTLDGIQTLTQATLNMTEQIMIWSVSGMAAAVKKTGRFLANVGKLKGR